MSEKLPILKAREIIPLLERVGFYVHHQTGSHVQMKHRSNPSLRITIPFHNRDIPKPVLRSILRQAQMSIEEFNALR